MLKPGADRSIGHVALLAVGLVAAALFTLACSDSGGPTAPVAPNPPLTSASGATAGSEVVGPGVDIEKATNGVDADVPPGANIAAGDLVTWTYVVTNTGTANLRGVTVTDDVLGAIGCPANVLLVGESMTCTETGVAVAGQYANIGTVVGLDPRVTDSDPSHYFGVAGGGPAIDIEKATNGFDADQPTGPQIPVGDPITWTYVVTNTGTAMLRGISVTDDVLGAIGCPATVLDVGASMTCTATGSAAAGQYANIGTVVGLDPRVTDSDPSHYFGVAGGGPDIDIEKATNGFDADQPTGPRIPVGDPITWTYEVTNTGTENLRGVTVTDDVLGAISCPADVLLVGDSMTCTATGVAAAGQYANIGTVVGLDPRVTDSDPSHYFGEEPPPGDFGCSQGYWKNHLGSWPPTGYSPSDTVGSVFVGAVVFPELAASTFGEALGFGGGPGAEGAARNLLRQAVASLLNAAHPGVAFPRTVTDVIAAVDAALLSEDRKTMNRLKDGLDFDNNLGCPLN